MLHDALSALTTHSTLAELPLHDSCVAHDVLGKDVAVEFDGRPDLPGVIIMEADQLLGVISREQFFQHLSRPHALEMYLHRPIHVLMRSIGLSCLALPASQSIHDAAQIALGRPNDLTYEPIIVRLADGQLRLMSTHVLLSAQSHILSLANRIIQQQMLAADAANRAKGQFLANISHEIRTPMNGILGLTELLLETDPTPQQREYLGMVKSSAEWLVNVINDVLDFTKIEAGKMRLEQLTIDLRQLFAESLKTLALRARSKGLGFGYTVDERIPALVTGDPVRLRQVLVNLVANAIKFTEQGRVDVGVILERASDTDLELRVHVADTGVGIPPDRLEKIFVEFEQADGTTTRKYGGSGLGLSISSHLVELMGGRIWVESQIRQGTTFYFTVRLQAVPAATVSVGMSESPDVSDTNLSHIESAPRSLRILLAEDNEVNQTLAVALLQKKGHHVTVVENGRDAVAQVQQQAFDVVLMDVQMPVMDGFEATQRIREWEAGQRQRLPIIAITAHAMSGDRQRCLDAGMDDYVSKPVRAADLFRALRHAVAADSSSTGESIGAAPVPAAATPEFKWQEAAAFTGGDLELLRSIIDVFLDESPKLVTNLRAANAAGDRRALQRAAHSLKGSCDYLAAHSARRAAASIEQAAATASAETIDALTDELVEVLERLRPGLEEFQANDHAAAH